MSAGHSSLGADSPALYRRAKPRRKTLAVDVVAVAKRAVEESELSGKPITFEEAMARIQGAVAERGTLDPRTRTGAALGLAREMTGDLFGGGDGTGG